MNKHLIPLANKPMIVHAIEKVKSAGITDIILNVNPGDTEMSDALGDGSKYGVNLSYLEQKGGARGVAHVVKNAQEAIGGGPFLVFLGDNIVLGDLDRFVRRFNEEKLHCMLAFSRVKDPQRFGVPKFCADGSLDCIIEKPENPPSDYAVTGIYIYDEQFFQAFDTLTPSERGEYEISDVNTWYIKQGQRVGWEEITGWWKDTGKPEDLLEANRLTLDRIIGDHESLINGKVDDASDIAGKVIIENGAQIIRSSIRGPAIIGENTIVEDSYIGPFTSIYYGCQIKNSEVEYSIILEKCKIIDADIRIERSLLGREAEIIKCRTKPRTQKFIIGDQSIVELI